jgi:hypothetical protein
VPVLRGLDAVVDLGRPIRPALSRKDFVGALTRRAPGERGADVGCRRRPAPHAGADLRVHDVAATLDMLTVLHALTGPGAAAAKRRWCPGGRRARASRPGPACPGRRATPPTPGRGRIRGTGTAGGSRRPGGPRGAGGWRGARRRRRPAAGGRRRPIRWGPGRPRPRSGRAPTRAGPPGSRTAPATAAGHGSTPRRYGPPPSRRTRRRSAARSRCRRRRPRAWRPQGPAGSRPSTPRRPGSRRDGARRCRAAPPGPGSARTVTAGWTRRRAVAAAAPG